MMLCSIPLPHREDATFFGSLEPLFGSLEPLFGQASMLPYDFAFTFDFKLENVRRCKVKFIT